jgi:CubicO group peptidase (beta-lactamase class C family)
VEETLKAILNGEAGALHSFLLVRDGSLVIEEYYHGWTAEDLQQFASCTKSVSSLLVGIAIDQGFLEGVNVPLLDFFPEQADGAGQGWEELRLRHFLTMTMGLDWTDAERRHKPALDIDRFADILGRNVVTPPGTTWHYADRNMSLLPGVLLAATGVAADRFAATHLFAPLGISSWSWDEGRQGAHPDMVGSLKLQPRSMAKLGQLVLDEGSWQGRRVVSAEWIRESTRTHVEETDGADSLGYGFLWWQDETPLGNMIMAMGTGSQNILVLPNPRIVIVTTAGNQFNQQAWAIFDLLDRYLVPGVR